MRIARQSSFGRPPFLMVGVGTRSNHLRPKDTVRRTFGRPFRASLWAAYPGLKPWAILFRHFMAIYASPHRPNALRFPFCSSVAN